MRACGGFWQFTVFQFRNFPLVSIHQNAFAGARAAARFNRLAPALIPRRRFRRFARGRFAVQRRRSPPARCGRRR